jgi:hypothetical protein
MKSLLYLKQEYPEMNVGFIYTSEEGAREAFDYFGFPQSVYIKNGKPYYLPWEAFQINRYQEFLFRYKYLAVEGSYKELNPPATGFMLFFELY